MESGPDGVRGEVEEQDEDGNTQKRTYEAETLDELLELHPELRGRLQAGSPGAGWGADVRELFDRLRERRGAAPFGSVAVPTDKLGILMRAPGSFRSSVPGLDEDTGLFVERVLPGTLAAELGIRAGDVLTHLDGRALSSAEDVQAALSARRAGDRLTAEVVDARGERRTLSWRPPEMDAATELRRL
jgi:membrane-associated protease RseP (regulator of RpoE activity)